MAFEGLAENLKNSFINIKDKILESSLAQKLQEKYQNLNPNQQKIVFQLFNVITISFILYFPLEHFISSNEFTLEFESKRSLTKNLIKSHREVNHLPDIPVPQTSENVKATVENYIKDMHFAPEQIKYINVTTASSKLIPDKKILFGIEVAVSKLNIKQITNLGSKLQSIHPALKLKDMLLNANREDGRYQDGIFKLVALNIPQYTPPPPEPEPVKKSKKSKNKSEDSE